MNPKILLAFLGGAALASGIVYMAVKPDSKPVTKTLYVAPVEQVSRPAPAEPVSSPVTAVESVSKPVSTPPVSAKPSRKEAPVRIARASTRVLPPKSYELPPHAVKPAPATTPAPTVIAGVTAPPLPPPPPANPEPVATPASVPPPPEPTKVEPPQPHTVTLTAGTQLSVRIGETLSSHRNKPGDKFLATLAEPLTIDDFVIAERGARCEGRIVEADPGGRVKGVARLGLELTGIHTADGQKVRIRTASFSKEAQTSRREDAAKVGGGAAIGAIIGAIAGGGKGAGIGAAAGGAAGAGDVVLTRGKPAEIPVETRLSFRVQEPVTITERLQ